MKLKAMVSIYILINPINDKVFYVGASCEPETRLRAHVHEYGTSYKHLLIEKIISKGYRPEMVILECVDEKEVRQTEDFYVNLFKFYGFKIPQRCSGYKGNKSALRDYIELHKNKVK